MPKTKYYHELPLKEMIQYHDFTYCMSDDNRYYEQGKRELEQINDKVEFLVTNDGKGLEAAYGKR